MRQIGIDSTVVATTPHPFGFKEDMLLPDRRGLARGLRTLDWLRLRDYDVFHNHDVVVPRTVKRLWKGRIVQHFHAPVVAGAEESAALTLTSLPGVIRQVPDAVWMPLPCRTDVYRPELRRCADKVRIGYSAQTIDPKKAPLLPVAEILAAVEAAGGLAVAAPLSGVVDLADMPDYYAGIDLWVDRIGAGFYGFSAIEVAAMGIPVVTQIGGFERQYVPECPFVTVERESLSQVLEELIRDPGRATELGDQARAYVVEVHDAVRVARLCVEQYRLHLGIA